MADEYEERFWKRLVEKYGDKDWAFLKGKPSGRQLSLIDHILNKNPAGVMNLGRCGIDYGGHQAYWSIVNGLVRQGFARIQGRDIHLLTGEPVAIQKVTLGKPFIKVKKLLVPSYHDEQIMDMETTVWLDPRGDGEFIIIMPDEMTEVFDRDERMVRVESSMDGVGMHAAAKAPTFKSVVATAAALAREYQAVTCGDIKDVLVINHNCQLPKDDSFRRYDIATLAVGFYKCMLINGDALWRREPNGKLTRIIVMPDKLGTEKAREYMLEREKSVVMLYSPEREAALIAMRDRLASMAREFMRLINEEDIAALIETHGHKLLTGGS